MYPSYYSLISTSPSLCLTLYIFICFCSSLKRNWSFLSYTAVIPHLPRKLCTKGNGFVVFCLSFSLSRCNRYKAVANMDSSSNDSSCVQSQGGFRAQKNNAPLIIHGHCLFNVLYTTLSFFCLSILGSPPAKYEGNKRDKDNEVKVMNN